MAQEIESRHPVSNNIIIFWEDMVISHIVTAAVYLLNLPNFDRDPQRPFLISPLFMTGVSTYA